MAPLLLLCLVGTALASSITRSDPSLEDALLKIFKSFESAMAADESCEPGQSYKTGKKMFFVQRVRAVVFPVG